jgi:dihydroorotate dehydrogenase (NAD+) catalytic subunit
VSLIVSNGKRDLILDPPIINVSGFLGYGEEATELVDFKKLGAIITGPVSMTPRAPAREPRMLTFAGGFLLHTGHPNPGLSRVIVKYGARWAAMNVQVIVHLLGGENGEVPRMVERLEAVEGVEGVELGLGPGYSKELEGLIARATDGELPIICQVPFGCDEDLLHMAEAEGAVAVSFSAPRGSLPSPGGEHIEGRLYGPTVLPWALREVSRLSKVVGIPVIGSGGVYAREDLEAMMAAGAAAVQVGPILWTEPEQVLST